MKRTRYVWDSNQKALVEIGARDYREVNAPFVIQDTIDTVMHPGTCAYTDSRSMFRRMTKASGLSERDSSRVAPSNPNYRDMDSDSFARDVKIAYEQVKSGNAPLSEYDREMCRRMDERIRNR